MGREPAHVADLQSVDETVLREPAADGISSLAADFRSADGAYAVCAVFLSVVVVGGVAHHRVCHHILSGRGFFVVCAEPGVWIAAVSAGAYLVACADVVVVYAAGLLGVFAGGRGVLFRWGVVEIAICEPA